MPGIPLKKPCKIHVDFPNLVISTNYELGEKSEVRNFIISNSCITFSAFQNKKFVMEKDLLTSAASINQLELADPLRTPRNFPNTTDTEEMIEAERFHSNTVLSHLPKSITKSVKLAPYSTSANYSKGESEGTSSTTTMDHTDGQSRGTISKSANELESNVITEGILTGGGDSMTTTTSNTQKTTTSISNIRETTRSRSEKYGNVRLRTTSAKSLRSSKSSIPISLDKLITPLMQNFSSSSSSTSKAEVDTHNNSFSFSSGSSVEQTSTMQGMNWDEFSSNSTNDVMTSLL